MRAAFKNIINPDVSLHALLPLLVEHSKAVKETFGFGGKFSPSAGLTEWNKFQHDVGRALASCTGTAKRQSQAAIIWAASSDAAQELRDVSDEAVVSIETDILPITEFRPRIWESFILLLGIRPVIPITFRTSCQ